MHRMIEMHSKYDNMHINVMFYVSEYVPYNGIPVILSLLLSLYVYGPSPLHKGRHPPFLQLIKTLDYSSTWYQSSWRNRDGLLPYETLKKKKIETAFSRPWYLPAEYPSPVVQDGGGILPAEYPRSTSSPPPIVFILPTRSIPSPAGPSRTTLKK